MLIYRAHLSMWPLGGAAPSEQGDPSNGAGHDWVCTELSLRGNVKLLLGVVYLSVRGGLQGEANANKISEILAFAQKWLGPLMLLGE